MQSNSKIEEVFLHEGIIYHRPGPHSPLLEQYRIEHRFVSAFEPTERHWHSTRQVHGTATVEASFETFPIDIPRTKPDLPKRPEADAIYTIEKSLAVGVRTADCLPILIADQLGQRVMAIHAGWRGLTEGIIPQALQKFLRKVGFVDASNIVAAIGPRVCADHFEVGPEVVEALQDCGTRYGINFEPCVRTGARERWHIDLALAAALQILASGIKGQHLSVMKSCTVEDDSLWSSYRRDGRGCPMNHSWIKTV